jgi:hypothetical protein
VSESGIVRNFSLHRQQPGYVADRGAQSPRVGFESRILIEARGEPLARETPDIEG